MNSTRPSANPWFAAPMRALSVAPLLVAVAAGCAPQAKPDEAGQKNKVTAAGANAAAATAAFNKAITAANALYVAEVNSPKPDWAKISQLYTDDAVVLYPMTDIIVGRQAIEATYKATAKDVNDVVLQTIKAEHDNDVGYEIGSFSDKITDLQGKVVPIAGTYLTIWKRGADGVWRMAANMSMNTTEAPEFSGSNPGGPGFKRRTDPLGGDSGDDIDAVRAAIADTNASYTKVINGGDPHEITALSSSLYSPEATLLLPTLEPINGTAAIGEFLGATVGVVGNLDMTTLRVETSGRLAYEIGSLGNVTMDMARGTPVDVQGYYITVWENTSTGGGAASYRIIAGGDTDTTTCPPLL